MYKIENMKNGYVIDNDTTNEEWQAFCDKHDEIKCIICNNQTAKHFRVSGLFGKNIITINNKLLDDVVYINGVF